MGIKKQLRSLLYFVNLSTAFRRVSILLCDVVSYCTEPTSNWINLKYMIITVIVYLSVMSSTHDHKPTYPLLPLDPSLTSSTGGYEWTTLSSFPNSPKWAWE